jgi:hypothetical protein
MCGRREARTETPARSTRGAVPEAGIGNRSPPTRQEKALHLGIQLESGEIERPKRVGEGVALLDDARLRVQEHEALAVDFAEPTGAWMEPAERTMLHLHTEVLGEVEQAREYPLGVHARNLTGNPVQPVGLLETAGLPPWFYLAFRAWYVRAWY